MMGQSLTRHDIQEVAAVSKTAEGNLVRVRLPLSAPRFRIQIDRILLSKWPQSRHLGARLTTVLTAVEAGTTQLSSSLQPGLEPIGCPANQIRTVVPPGASY